jgi:hypothetical protein
MNSHLIPFIVIWAILAVVVIVLIAWRKAVSVHEDDSLHVSQAGASQQQVGLAAKLDQIDKWGKILTVIVVVYGLILASVYFYQMWVASSSIGV